MRFKSTWFSRFLSRCPPRLSVISERRACHQSEWYTIYARHVNTGTISSYVYSYIYEHHNQLGRHADTAHSTIRACIIMSARVSIQNTPTRELWGVLFILADFEAIM